MKLKMISAVCRASFGLVGAALALSPLTVAHAQLPQRLSQSAASTPAVAISGTASKHAVGAQAMGHLAGNTQMTRMSLVLQPTDAQKAALLQLLQDQQNPGSGSYHQWLTPAQYGARFGVSDTDLNTIESWLTSRGLQIVEVPASRTSIVFSGTSSVVESAFGVTLQNYMRNGQQFFANSTDVSLPSGLSTIVGGVRGLSSYRIPAPQTRKVVAPSYTTTGSKGTVVHNLVPWDFRQIYGMNTLTNQGYDGTGIKIAVIGQSAVNTTQIGYFQTLTGQTAKAPTLTLMPNTGTSTFYTGDEGESEIDIEYAGGTAPGAAINFVYTGNGNYGVFDALIYSIENNLAPIVTMSYGECENQAASDAAVLEPYFQEANAQGQTVLVSSGDSGSASCDPPSTSTATTFTLASGGLAVSYPASSPYVTGTGGTQLNSDASNYWLSTNNSFGGSAQGYIPEIAWNDTAAASGVVSASGGGYSMLFSKPSWQTGTGVPSDGHRDVPDVSFSASDYNHGYEYCSGENTSTTTGQTQTAEACTTSAFSSYVVGGTSLAAPNFAAMLALIEQANKSTGLGNINANLYSFAAGSSAASIFNDVTSGNNIVPCTGATTGCSSTSSSTNGTMGFTAGTGYDQVTGLGSVNAPALQTALNPGGTSTLQTPTVSLSASFTAVLLNTGVTFTASAVSPGSSIVPTGTITFSVDGNPVGSAVALSSGVATYSYAGFTTTGDHTITAVYSGNGVFTAAKATLAMSAGGFTLTPSPATVTVTAGNTGSSNFTVASTGYDGEVSFTVTDTTGKLSVGCYDLSDASVTANGSAIATITLYTSASACSSASANGRKVSFVARTTSSKNDGLPGHRSEALIALTAGLLCCFGLRRRLPSAGLFMAALLSVALLGVAGCSSSGLGSSTTTTTTTSTSNTATGTYPIQVTATSTVNNSITSTSTVTLVVQ